MNARAYQKIYTVLWLLSIVAAVAHLAWCVIESIDRFSIGIESFLLNVLPYGIPMVAFARARGRYKKEEARPAKGEGVFGVLFALSYLVMLAHVTAAGLSTDKLGNPVAFINVYFNIPIIYLVPMALFGIADMHARAKPSKDATKTAKILYALPLVLLWGMVGHCGIVCAIEYTNRSLSSSAPWWIMPLVIGFAYLAAALVFCGVYAAYRCATKRRK